MTAPSTNVPQALADEIASIPTAGAAPQADRYVIGRDGPFATLWDCQENRPVVENSTEDHCREVRDELLAAYRQGQLAEQLHQYLDLDLDSTYTMPGCICPAAHRQETQR